MLFGKSKSLVGLDIGSNSVKLVELKSQSKGDKKWKLVNLSVEPLSPEVIVDGSIMDSSMVVDAINKLFAEHKIKFGDVAIAVSGHSVIIKKITMAAMSDEELSESIRWEAESYIPFDIDDVYLDYQVLSEEEDEGNMEVLLVAAKKEKVSEYVSVVQQSGKNPVIVDVDSFALQNALTQNYDLPEGDICALINIGASIMNINIMRGQTPLFWRDISFGGNMYSDAIQKDLGVDFDTAELLKRGESVEGISFESVTPILQSVTNDLGVEIQKTFDFFKATSSAEDIHRVVLSGGGSNILNLDAFLNDRFQTTVDMLNPFQSISYNEKQFSAQFIHDHRSSAAIAVGLAMRRAGDK